MRVILDTGAFFRPKALLELNDADAPIVVPAVAYAERLRQITQHGQAEADFEHYLAMLGCTVEAFTARQARRFIPGLARQPQRLWERLARDAMIAGHLEPGDHLWTTNGKDFFDVGVPADQIVQLPSP